MEGEAEAGVAAQVEVAAEAVASHQGEDVQEVEVEVLAVDVVIGAIDDHPLDVVVHDIHLHVALHPVLQLIALHMRTT